MDYNNPSHPFYSTDNIERLLRLIEARVLEVTGSKVRFEANEKFIQEMHTAAEQYPNYLVTSVPSEGVERLNDLVARRAVNALTEIEDAGQYTPGNIFYKQTRKTRRFDDGITDHDRQTSAVTLGGNVYKKRNDKCEASVGSAGGLPRQPRGPQVCANATTSVRGHQVQAPVMPENGTKNLNCAPVNRPMSSSSIDTFAQQCADYCLKSRDSTAAHAKMTQHIKTNVPDSATQAIVLSRFNTLVQMADEPPPAAAPAAAAPAAEDEDLSEEESEEDEESGDEIDLHDDADEDVFDLDQFQKKGKFQQDEAEKAYHAWRDNRNKRKRPLHFMQTSEADEDPIIPEDAFRSKQRELTQRLIDRDLLKMKEIDQELEDTTLTPRERKKLTQMRGTLEWTVRERQGQMA